MRILRIILSHFTTRDLPVAETGLIRTDRTRDREVAGSRWDIRLVLLLLLTMSAASCTQEGDTITNITAPEDWQPPILEWQSEPDAEVRGTVGIDVSVTDSSQISWVRLYQDGLPIEELTAPPYRFEVTTDSLDDGVHILEARALDEHGNLGISPVLRINVMNSVAQGPQLIWVPDDYELIQAAINAATDFDTIRVRDGVYYETLNLFGKGLWIESENGPMGCTVDANGASRAFWVSPTSIPVTIRGFWITGGNAHVSPDQAILDFFNNIIISNSAWTHFISSYSTGQVHNNLFSGSQTAVQIGYHWGSFQNNIITFASNVALWNATEGGNPVSIGFNAYWQNAQNFFQFEPSESDIFSDPLIDLELGMLLEGSPCIDTGNPTYTDLDGSRSDIGPFGGPWAYNH